jgi:hypothetical protein
MCGYSGCVVFWDMFLESERLMKNEMGPKLCSSQVLRYTFYCVRASFFFFFFSVF